MKIFSTTLFCFFCQVAFSLFLLVSFRMKQDYYIVNWQMQVARFICACLIHFQFQTKVTSSYDRMKFVATHHNKFAFPYLSFTFAALHFIVNIFIEIVNIWNLTYIGEIMDLVINYVALGCIAEFDENFLEMYKQHNFVKFIENANNGSVFERVNYIKAKLRLGYINDPAQKQGRIPAYAYQMQEKLNFDPTNAQTKTFRFVVEGLVRGSSDPQPVVED